jgi:NTE family protein
MTATLPRSSFTLVLGGGGLPGLAYLAGALRALRDRGVEPDAADLVIGTSAGALTGALLRSGCPVDELMERTAGADAGRPAAMGRSWTSPGELVARSLGTSWVLARSTLRVPWPAPPARLGRHFRGGLSAPTGAAAYAQLPTGWPERPYWAVAVDLVSGRRVALGRRPADEELPFPKAVRASGAVPGVFEPVRHGRKLLVDGGVHSVTNLDLAAAAHPRTVICIAPLAYDPAAPPGRGRQLLRARNNAVLRQEQFVVRARGAKVLALRPGRLELEDFRVNFLRTEGLDRVHDAAYAHTLASLEAEGAEVLDRLVSAAR